jgi:transketolase
MHPCDYASAEQLTIQLAPLDSPSYTRTARNKTPIIYDEESASQLRIGKGFTLREGGDVAIIACGVMVSKALEAAEKLAADSVEATVIDMHTIKPLDLTLMTKLANTCGCFVTVEDHSIIGGLGGAVAEFLSENCPSPLRRIGVRDHFGESGDGEELLNKYAMGVSDIVSAAKQTVQRK